MPQADTPTARPRRGARGLLLALLTTLLLALGFTLVGSLSAAVSQNRYWMFSSGLLICLVLPVILASWIRGVRRRGKGEGAPAVTRPGSVSMIATANLVLVLAAALAAPATTARHLERHGAWWVESIAGLVSDNRDSPVVRGARRTTEWLAGLLPGGVEEQRVTAALDGGGTAGDGGGGTAAVASQDAAIPDSTLVEPPVAGEVRLRFERRGTAVIVPVTLHGPQHHANVKMLFDTGATLTTINQATLTRLGLGVSPGDPTIETNTAAGKARRTITVIEGVTLAVARISGGVTVAICEPCAHGEVVGLLGLNVLRHFKVTLDDEAGQVVLRQRTRGSPSGDLADVRPFLKLSDAKGAWRGPMLTATATLHNQSPRRVSYVKLVAEVRKGDKVGQVWGEVRDLPPRARRSVQLEGLSPVRGESFQLKIERADW